MGWVGEGGRSFNPGAVTAHFPSSATERAAFAEEGTRTTAMDKVEKHW